MNPPSWAVNDRFIGRASLSEIDDEAGGRTTIFSLRG